MWLCSSKILKEKSILKLDLNDYRFCNLPEKDGLRLSKLRAWLKNKKYFAYITSNALYNTKLQGPALKPKDNFSNKLFVTTFCKDTRNRYGPLVFLWPVILNVDSFVI